MSKIKSYLFGTKAAHATKYTKTYSGTLSDNKFTAPPGIVYVEDSGEIKVLQEYVHTYNVKEYPSNFPYFIKSDYINAQYVIHLQIGVDIETAHPENSDTTDYQFITLLTVSGKDAHSTINAFKAISLDSDLKEYVYNFYK